MRQVLWGVLVFFLVPAAAHAQLSIYENWSANALRGDRWRGGEDAIFSSVGGLEADRSIGGNVGFGKELTMRVRVQSSSLSDPRAGLNLMHAAHVGPSGTPGSVDALDVTFRIASKNVTKTQRGDKPGCPAGAGPNDPSGVSVVVMMTKFNDGSSSGPGDRTGDIAVLASSRYNTDFLHFDLFAVMFRCGNPSCFSGSSVPGSARNLVGTVTPGNPFRLGIVDNYGSNEYQITFNGAVVGTIDYASVSVAPAVAYDASFGVRADTGNCWVGSPAPNMVADITAKVGKVRTNAGAVIP